MIAEMLTGFFGVYYGIFVLMAFWTAYDEEWCRCMRWWKRVARACDESKDRHFTCVHACAKERFACAKVFICHYFQNVGLCKCGRIDFFSKCGCLKKYFKQYSILSQEEG